MSRFFASKPTEQGEAFSAAGTYGLEILCAPENARADIVFVHGLTGNRENTWIHRKSNVFWPKDLLPKDVEKTRIMTFGYDANIVSALDTASSNTLRDHGKALAQDLAMKRIRSKSEDRPLIFVAHSLGGLVVEQTLLISRGASQSYTKALLESTLGIIFMGTPHMGSDHAKWGQVLLRLSSLFRQTNSEIMHVLDPGSEMLANLQQEFHTMLDDRARNHGKELEIFCFFEEQAMLGVGMIVPHHSAILPRYPNQGIHSTHTEMTKFSSRDDADYERVSGRLDIWCSNLPTQTSVHEIRNKRVEKFVQLPSASPEYSGNINTGGGNNIQGVTYGSITIGSPEPTSR